MTTFCTSDNHFWHQNVISFCQRPFTTVEEMNRGLIERANAVVKKDDIVYCLGDFALGSNKDKTIPEILKQLNGNWHLVHGNHDKSHPSNGKNAEEAVKRYLGYGFKEVVTETHIGPFLANHLPYELPDRVEKLGKYRPIDKGEWLLHGHVHEKFRTRGKGINVGVDVWEYTPVALDALIILRDELIKQGTS